MEKLYHGSYIQNLKEIEPKESAHNKPYVYAVSDLAFAALFSVPVRNTFIASWGRLKNGIPYFCEIKEGAFDLFYQGKKSSIYILNSKNFFQKENMWKDEYISEKSEDVLEEIQIHDVKEYLLSLQKEHKFKLIDYKDRKKYFPNIDEDSIKNAMKMIAKYESKRMLKAIEQWRPDILERVKMEIKNTKTE